MDVGVINTRIKGNSLHGTWNVENVGPFKFSPLIILDTFDKFKIMFRLKSQVNPKTASHELVHQRIETYYIQTMGVYGAVPENLTISIGRDPLRGNAVSFIPNTSWTEIRNELTGQTGTIIHFKIEWLYGNIAELYSPECSFSNISTEPGAEITIEASDGKQKNVHKTVLLARSDVFRAMWQNDMLESKANHLMIPELDENSLNSFVSYLYHGDIEDCNLNICFILLNIADKYNIKHLITKCQINLQKKLSKDNVIFIFYHADLHNLQNLKALTVEYALGNMEAIVLTKAWRKTKDVSFFKRVCEDLLRIENKEVTVGKILQSVTQTTHYLKIQFPIDARHRSDKLHQMTVSQETGYGTFLFRVLERDTQYFKLSVCQCEYGGDFNYTNIKFSDIKIHATDARSSSTLSDPQVSEMVTNEWYDIGLFRILQQQLTVTLELSYDIKYNPKNCAFTELLTDSSSADMTLESSDGIFRQVHKSVLIARNLRAMVDQCDTKDHLKLCELSALALDEFINFIYLVDNEELNADYCAELITIAQKYDLPAMKYKCEAKLTRLLSTKIALELLSLAALNNAIFLERSVLDYFHLNKVEIIETEDWQNFNNCDAIKKIIKHHLELKKLPTTATASFSSSSSSSSSSL